MIVLLLYLLGFVIYAKVFLITVPEVVSPNKVLLAAVFFPFALFFKIINIPLSFMGVYLQYQPCILLSEEEKKNVSDKQDKELSDIFDKIKKDLGLDEEK